MRTSLLLRACEKRRVKNTFHHPRPAILRRLYEGSENPGKLRNIGKKKEGAPQ